MLLAACAEAGCPVSSGYFLYERNGQHVIRYKTPLGRWTDRRVPKRITSKRDAKVYAEQFVSAQRHMLNEPLTFTHLATDVVHKSEIKIPDVYPQWIERCKQRDVAPSSNIAYESIFNAHVLKSWISRIPIAELTKEHMWRFLRELKGKSPQNSSYDQLANVTVRNVMLAVDRFFADCFKFEWAADNPNVQRKYYDDLLPKRHTRTHKTQTKVWIPKPDLEKLVQCSAVPTLRRVKYLIAGTSGARDGEIQGWDWSDAKLSDTIPTIRVTKAFRRINNHEGDQGMGEPKRISTIRTIPLHPTATAVLEQWKAVGWERWVGRKPKSSDPIFPNDNGDFCRSASAKTIRADLQRAGCSAEVNAFNVTFHSLRRTFSTLLEDEHVESPVIEKLMGLGNKSVRYLHYTEIQLRQLSQAVAKLQLSVSAEEVLGTAGST